MQYEIIASPKRPLNTNNLTAKHIHHEEMNVYVGKHPSNERQLRNSMFKNSCGFNVLLERMHQGNRKHFSHSANYCNRLLFGFPSSVKGVGLGF